eukprot:jgi/Orpsp1_1/1185361/evm.model.c7180000093418.1
MNLVFIILLITLKFVNAILVSRPTNITKTFLENYNEEVKIKCNNTEDCPFGLLCDPEYNHCFASGLLCNDAENINCLFLEYEKTKDKETSKIIIESCENNNTNCKTEKCNNNEDCYSGLCSSHKCIFKNPIYVCSHTESENLNSLLCQKYNNMKCSDSNECDSSYCNSEGYCEYSEGGGESSVGSAVGKFFNLIYIFVGSL